MKYDSIFIYGKTISSHPRLTLNKYWKIINLKHAKDFWSTPQKGQSLPGHIVLLVSLIKHGG